MKCFFVSFNFPPKTSSNALNLFKTFKKSQFNFCVFSEIPKKEMNEWLYKEEKQEMPKNFDILYEEFINVDDWIAKCISYFDRHNEDFDFIFTKSNPVWSHKVGLILKKKYPEKKWCSYFSDPIIDNPYDYINCSKIKFKLKTNKIFPKIFFPIIDNSYRLYYEDVMLISDALFFTNKYQLKYSCFNKKTRNKSFVLHHSYDESLYPRVNNNNSKVVINHLGFLDDVRTPKNIFKAIKILKNKDKQLNEKIELNFYGTMSKSDKKFVDDNNLKDTIRINNQIKFLESLRIMKESDYLLLIDGDLSRLIDSSIFYPGKLADYMGANRNIIALTMRKGHTADVITEIGGILIDYNINNIKNTFLEIIDEFQKNKKVVYKMNENIKKYSNEKIGKYFDMVIKKIILDG